MLFGWFGSRSLDAVLNATKVVKVQGIKFRIKKIDPFATMDGSRILQKQYETFEVGGKDQPKPLPAPDKVKTYFRDVFMACVVEPKLYRDLEEAKANNGTYVDYLFTEWSLVEDLHGEIMLFTHGKKKLRSVGLLNHT